MRTSRTPLRHSYAWLVVWLLAGIAGGPEDLVSDGLGYGGAVGVYLVVGLLLGVLWSALYPRPFGERIRAIAHVVVALLAIVAGLFLAGRWRAGSADVTPAPVPR